MAKLHNKPNAPSKRRWIGWVAVAVLGGGAVYAAFRLGTPPPIEVPTARVQRGEFVISVRGRGEIKSARSVIIAAPQTPQSRIVRLAPPGKNIRKGEVVVEFDPVTQEQTYIERSSSVRQVDSEIVQAQAQHRIINEQDGMVLMQTQYNLERAKLEASKQEILSEILGAKNRIDVGVAEGEVTKANVAIQAHKQSQRADLTRLNERKDKTVRDMDRAKKYLESMVLRAPADGMVILLPNFRSGGQFGSSPPPFKEGDNAWTGAPIAEIPDMSDLQAEFRIEEVDRGLLKEGQQARIKVDAVPDLDLEGTLSWISPIAQLLFRSFPPEKNFPAKARIQKADPRLRPGMSATAEVIIERQASALVIPIKASFELNGKPAVFIQKGDRYERQHIQAGKRNATDLVVLAGLTEGQVVALENPEEAAKKKMAK
ncbi:MAG TPA: efflux RND transporter periplasmic adaptor subunit [Anaerolineales bacterium]|nr:efflux RND transporter periplasmic adaptor subunit [Anaerolineales bacterium]